MDKIIDVTGGQGGKAFLLVGEKKAALIDCGMAYCASVLISNIKHILNIRELDYILISHSHYDHIGAIPYLKQEWPMSRVLGAAYAKRILKRANALKTVRDLSKQAAEIFGSNERIAYNDDLLGVDHAIGDGDALDLGGMHIKVIETLGHTRCSLSFLVNQTLFASESTGYMSKSGTIYPSFITSCCDAIHSIHMCQKINPHFIISPHYGLVSRNDTPSYWTNCIFAVQETKNFILHLANQGFDEEQILIRYENLFRDEYSRSEQPLNAFYLNTRSMIKSVLREEFQVLPIAK